MLEITIPEAETWDERTQEFSITKAQVLMLEHSLIAISKWESKWCKPFFSKEPKTDGEMLDYIRCMSIKSNISLTDVQRITPKNLREINEYINSPMTATTFSAVSGPRQGREIVTSELIYYWMITLGIPMECSKWHINRLLTLIKVCSIKNQPSKKMSKREIMSRNAALNAARRKQYGSHG